MKMKMLTQASRLCEFELVFAKEGPCESVEEHPRGGNVGRGGRTRRFRTAALPRVD